MIVIMRDAIMPDCCNTCVCSEGYGCGITGTIMTTKEMESRPDMCPLEEVELCEDAVSRRRLLDDLEELVTAWEKYPVMAEQIKGVETAIGYVKTIPSVQPEITDERAIEHLQSTGWMQNHDKEMYEMGLRERLADDGGSYDSLLPSAQPESCGDAVSRNAIIRALNTMDRYVSDELTLCDTDRKFPKNEVFIVDDVYEEIAENLPSVQPEQNDAEFWRKRSDEYEKMFLDLYWRMMNGVKFESMQFDKNGITLKMKESSREDNT